jgi:hypothetical protein
MCWARGIWWFLPMRRNLKLGWMRKLGIIASIREGKARKWLRRDMPSWNK